MPITLLFVISTGTIQSPMLSFLLGEERSVYTSTQYGKQLPLMNGYIHNGGGGGPYKLSVPP
jgi:hypothetical protein